MERVPIVERGREEKSRLEGMVKIVGLFFCVNIIAASKGDS